MSNHNAERIGMYTWHRPYRKPLDQAELVRIRATQGERVRSKRIAENNARKIMSGRLV